MGDTHFISYSDLTEYEKESALNSYVSIRYCEEEGYFDSDGLPCTEEDAYERAKEMIEYCKFERLSSGVILVLI